MHLNANALQVKQTQPLPLGYCLSPPCGGKVSFIVSDFVVTRNATHLVSEAGCLVVVMTNRLFSSWCPKGCANTQSNSVKPAWVEVDWRCSVAEMSKCAKSENASFRHSISHITKWSCQLHCCCNVLIDLIEQAKYFRINILQCSRNIVCSCTVNLLNDQLNSLSLTATVYHPKW